jgi:hypothetical protein
LLGVAGRPGDLLRIRATNLKVEFRIQRLRFYGSNIVFQVFWNVCLIIQPLLVVGWVTCVRIGLID